MSKFYIKNRILKYFWENLISSVYLLSTIVSLLFISAYCWQIHFQFPSTPESLLYLVVIINFVTFGLLGSIALIACIHGMLGRYLIDGSGKFFFGQNELKNARPKIFTYFYIQLLLFISIIHLINKYGVSGKLFACLVFLTPTLAIFLFSLSVKRMENRREIVRGFACYFYISWFSYFLLFYILGVVAYFPKDQYNLTSANTKFLLAFSIITLGNFLIFCTSNGKKVIPFWQRLLTASIITHTA